MKQLCGILLGLALLPSVARGSAPSAVMVSPSANPAVLGAAVTLTATVMPPSATGKITFYLGASVLGTASLVNGHASLKTSQLTSGTQPLLARYSGDASFSPGASAGLPLTVKAVPATNFGAPINGGTVSNGQSVVSGDFNLDGKTDFAFAAGNYNIAILLGNGDGTFQPPRSFKVNAAIYALAVGDFDGDGTPDIAFTGGGVTVLLGNGDGTFVVPPPNPEVEFTSADIVIGDFNGDGRADVAYLAGYGITVGLGNGDGTFHETNYPSGGGVLAAADFNNDGKADLAVFGSVSSSSTVAVMLGNGDGTFQNGLNSHVSPVVLSLAVGDFNGDGIPDLVTTGFYGDVDLMSGKGDGTFLAPKQIANGAYSSPVVGDFNGDGITDLALTFDFDNLLEAIRVFKGKGDGTFQAPIDCGSGLSLFGLTVGEFNGDGRTDLAAIEDGQVNVILGNAGVATSVTLASSSPSPVYPQPVNVTATLTPALSIGSVTIIDNSIYPPVQQTASVQNGIASFSLVLSAGSRSLQAYYYSPSGNCVSQVLSQSVGQAATQIALTSTPNPSLWGQPVTLTATVSPANATGMVVFQEYLDGGYNQVGMANLVDGVATADISFSSADQDVLAVGSNRLQALYQGSLNYAGGYSPEITQTVNSVPTSLTLSSSANPSAPGQSVILTATVSPLSLGLVTFYDSGTKSLGGATLYHSAASLPLSLTAGVHALTAVDSGYIGYLSSQSSVFTQFVGAGPSVPPGGVVNSASLVPGFGSGSWITIYGSNLCSTTRTWTVADFSGNSLPTALDGVSVSVGGKSAYVFYISPTQLNVLAPEDDSTSSTTIQVTSSGVSANAVTVTKQPLAPELFGWSSSPKYVISLDAQTLAMIGPPHIYDAFHPTTPAAPGEAVTLYASSLGQTDPAWTDGRIIAAPLPLSTLPVVTIGGVNATVQYAGLIEAGLYQINVVIPKLPSGDAAVTVSVGGTQSQGRKYLPIQ